MNSKTLYDYAVSLTEGKRASVEDLGNEIRVNFCDRGLESKKFAQEIIQSLEDQFPTGELVEEYILDTETDRTGDDYYVIFACLIETK